MLRLFSGYIFSSILFACVHLQEDNGRLIFMDMPLLGNSQPKDAYIARETAESPLHYQKTSQVPNDDYEYRSSQDAYAIQSSQQNYQQQQQQYQQQPQSAYTQQQNGRVTQQGSVFYPYQSKDRYINVETQVPTQSYQVLETYTSRIPQVYPYQSKVYTTRAPQTTLKSHVYQAQGGYTTRSLYSTTSKSYPYQSQNTAPQRLSESFPYQSQNIPTVRTQQRSTNSFTLKPYTTRIPVVITKGSSYVSQDPYTTRLPKVPPKPVTRPPPPRLTTKPWVPSKTIIITQAPSVRLHLPDNITPQVSQTPVRTFQLVPSRSNQSPPDNSHNRGVSLTTAKNYVLPESQFTTSRPGKIPPYSKEVSNKEILPNFDHLDCACPRDLNPVCASNGLTYPNDCVFKCALKKENPDLILHHKGKCLSTTTTSERNLSVLTFVN